MTETKRTRASAPGSLMLLGEHAVLHGRRALACAVSRRIYVETEVLDAPRLRILSPLGEYDAALDELENTHHFRFVVETGRQYRKHLQTGLQVNIHSEFASDIGLGSSAAVTVATTAALAHMLGIDADKDSVFHMSRKIVRNVQQTGSGTDVAASVYGGVIAYRMDPIDVHCIKQLPPITLVYSGHKEPTVEVIRHVEQMRTRAPALYERIFDLMDESTANAVTALEAEDWQTLGAIMNINQGLMDALGVNTRTLSEIVFALRADPANYGAKISGSGLGDCVVGIGETTLAEAAYDVIGVTVSKEGLRVEQA